MLGYMDKLSQDMVINRNCRGISLNTLKSNTGGVHYLSLNNVFWEHFMQKKKGKGFPKTVENRPLFSAKIWGTVTDFVFAFISRILIEYE